MPRITQIGGLKPGGGTPLYPPVITSATSATLWVGMPATFLATASNFPAHFDAIYNGAAKYGNIGGAGLAWDTASFCGGGGGGAGYAGVNAGATANTPGRGGAGMLFADFAASGQGPVGGGGGGGGGVTQYGAPGGYGGGGDAGCNYGDVVPGAGSPNTGGGGGGGSAASVSSSYHTIDQFRTGGAGGSGVCVVKYTGPLSSTDGVLVQAGGVCYHRFSVSGRFTNTSASPLSVDVLLVGGGGGGGYFAAGGGGAGQVVRTWATTVAAGATVTITIGSGGAGGTASEMPGSNGSASSFDAVTAAGGGGGGGGNTSSYYHSAGAAGLSGGSGGGGTGRYLADGAGAPSGAGGAPSVWLPWNATFNTSNGMLTLTDPELAAPPTPETKTIYFSATNAMGAGTAVGTAFTLSPVAVPNPPNVGTPIAVHYDTAVAVALNPGTVPITSLTLGYATGSSWLSAGGAGVASTCGGGGGGATGSGAAGTSGKAGNGGDGTFLSILGVSAGVGAGGGGSFRDSSDVGHRGNGGSGGGGNGRVEAEASPSCDATGYGCGGGASGSLDSKGPPGGNGSHGVVQLTLYKPPSTPGAPATPGIKYGSGSGGTNQAAGFAADGRLRTSMFAGGPYSGNTALIITFEYPYGWESTGGFSDWPHNIFWCMINNSTIDLLCDLVVVGGGGGGGDGWYGGGGGGGEVVMLSGLTIPARGGGDTDDQSSFLVAIGRGGLGCNNSVLYAADIPAGENGYYSAFGPIKANGGGRGASDPSYENTTLPSSIGSGGGSITAAGTAPSLFPCTLPAHTEARGTTSPYRAVGAGADTDYPAYPWEQAVPLRVDFGALQLIGSVSNGGFGGKLNVPVTLTARNYGSSATASAILALQP